MLRFTRFGFTVAIYRRSQVQRDALTVYEKIEGDALAEAKRLLSATTAAGEHKVQVLMQVAREARYAQH